MRCGTAIRYTDGPLGVTRVAMATKFVPGITVPRGSTGMYVKQVPLLGDDWHLTVIQRKGETYWVPVHGSQFERRGIVGRVASLVGG